MPLVKYWIVIQINLCTSGTFDKNLSDDKSEITLYLSNALTTILRTELKKN